ncbi:hypothetical protein N7513_008577 [Penicillium frequentans]|nr:hypothetical protein N7513_008577 [Penicillium glabrum]
MAAADVAPQFGAELKDSFKPVNAWVSNGITWLEEIQQFYRERSAIEKEYAAKLSALCKKYQDRKAKKISPLSVGDTPTMTPGSLESASLTTWSAQLTTVEAHAAERDKFGTELVTHIAEPLKQAATQYEEVRKCHADYHGKLEKERDASYGELKKAKGKYDGACQEVESRRKKMDSSFDHGKTKAQSAFQQQLLEMNNYKNLYLLSINVTNKLKEKFFHEYVPEVLDGLQDLNQTRVIKLNALWTLATQLEKTSLTNSVNNAASLLTEIPRNDPRLDSMMFLQHNAIQTQEPANMGFEPSPVWSDDASIITDDAAKVFLRNLLGQSKAQVRELRVESDRRRREVEGCKKIRDNIRQGKDNRNELDIVRNIFQWQESLHEVDRKWLTAEVETSTIIAVVGDFKCQMKVPAECPGEQSKEEKKKLKAARQEQAGTGPTVDLESSAASTTAPSLTRQNTMNSLSSGYAASGARSVSNVATQPTPEDPTDEAPPPVAETKPNTGRKNRIMAPPPIAYTTAPPPEPAATSKPKGKMLYSYEATGPDEVTVQDGDNVTIVEADDGSGWLRVSIGGQDGLVPASYVEAAPAPSPVPSASSGLPERPGSTYSNSSASLAAPKRVGPAVAPRRGAKKLQYVEALYDYEARSDMEWNMTEGDRFVLVNRDSGDGWADVERGGVTKSVPANYIQEA